jgi:hypothetical protein
MPKLNKVLIPLAMLAAYGSAIFCLTTKNTFGFSGWLVAALSLTKDSLMIIIQNKENN